MAAPLIGLFVLAVFYTLHVGRVFFLPLLLAILLNLLLSPVVRTLRRAGVPEAVGAAIVLLLLFGSIAGTVYGLIEPAQAWISKVPASVAQIQGRLRKVRAPMEQVAKTAEKVEEVTKLPPDRGTTEVIVKGPSLTSQLLGTTQDLVVGAVEVFALLFFLLASGDMFLQKVVKVLPQLGDKKRAVAIARETQAQVSRYLLTITSINLVFGVVVAVAMKLLGMPSPVLWGVMAFVCEYVPYLGMVAMVSLLSLAAVATFESIGMIVAPPLTYLVLNAILENLVSPFIMGRSLRLNPVAILIGVVFWFWIWGIPGALIAVPSLVTFKIFCDHLESLQPIGEFLGARDELTP